MKKNTFKQLLVGMGYALVIIALSMGVFSPPACAAPEDAASTEAAGRGDASVRTENGKLVLNFDNADLVEVIRTLADLLGINTTCWIMEWVAR
ncbi:MAG: hypothetical protein R2860_07400 [Desulfobacterales bacterium]